MNLNSIKQCPTPLNTTFFSDFNRNVIHRGIKQSVYEKLKVKIDNQSEDALLALMRTVFVSNSENPYGDVNEQVRFMNGKVIKMATDQIAGGVAQYYGYLSDIDKPLTPMAVPKSTTVYGHKMGYNHQIGF